MTLLRRTSRLVRSTLITVSVSTRISTSFLHSQVRDTSKESQKVTTLLSSLEMIETNKSGSSINLLKQSDPEKSQVTLGTPMEMVLNKAFQLLEPTNTTGGRSGLTEAVESST